jgi:hypothetical protein
MVHPPIAAAIATIAPANVVDSLIVSLPDRCLRPLTQWHFHVSKLHDSMNQGSEM